MIAVALPPPAAPLPTLAAAPAVPTTPAAAAVADREAQRQARGPLGRLLFATGLVGASGTGGFGVSLAVHGVLLLVGVLWVVESQTDLGGVILSSTFGTEREEVVLDELDMTADVGGAETTLLTLPPLDLPEATDGTLADLAAAEATLGQGTGNGSGDGTGPVDEDEPTGSGRHVVIVEIVVGVGEQQRTRAGR